MGLDIVPLKRDDDIRVSFSYSGFNAFRERIAQTVGIDLYAMVGYRPGGTPWPSATDEPLVYLLDHSDCDGSLDWEACNAMADRFRAIIDTAFPEKDLSDPLGFYRESAYELADLIDAVDRGDYAELRFS